jgi:tRNA threonylcarbamoyladenosine biosynthesis protein TsaE
MPSFVFHADSERDTERLGAALSAALPNGAVVALLGTLGAGKTRLVQAIAAAEGVDPGAVVSPTFVLVHEYRGRRPIYHFDAYRLKDEDEFLALGAEEYFDREGLTMVEWADRVAGSLPRDYLTVSIDILAETQRRVTIAAEERRAGRYAQVVETLQRELAARSA